MRIKSPIPPLVFSFISIDNLLDGISSLKSKSKKSIYLLNSQYFLLINSEISVRQRHKIHLSEYGTYIGSGNIFKAYLEEHGKGVFFQACHQE